MKKLLIVLSLSLLSVWGADVLHNGYNSAPARRVVAAVSREDAWWNDCIAKCQGRDISKRQEVSAYIKDLAQTNYEAATWFLLGAKYGYDPKPCTEEQLKNLIASKSIVAEALWKVEKEGRPNPLEGLFSKINHQHIEQTQWVYASIVCEFSKVTSEHKVVADKAWKNVEFYYDYLHDKSLLSWQLILSPDEYNNRQPQIMKKAQDAVKKASDPYFKARNDKNSGYCRYDDFELTLGKTYMEAGENEESLGIVFEESQKFFAHATLDAINDIKDKKLPKAKPQTTVVAMPTLSENRQILDQLNFLSLSVIDELRKVKYEKIKSDRIINDLEDTFGVVCDEYSNSIFKDYKKESLKIFDGLVSSLNKGSYCTLLDVNAYDAKRVLNHEYAKYLSRDLINALLDKVYTTSTTSILRRNFINEKNLITQAINIFNEKIRQNHESYCQYALEQLYKETMQCL